MPKIIEVNNVTAYRGKTRVFDDLSLEIPQGAHTVILGPNGAGKSTLLKLLMQKIYPVQNENSSLRLFGRERWNVWELRKRLGIVSQDLQYEYDGNARGVDVILSGHYASIGTYRHQQFDEEDREHAHAIMETLGVEALKQKKFAAMSTGQRRRFLLGRALINDPRVLVLDEPTNGLDLKACFQYLDIVRSLMESGKTVILTTHHLHEIPPELSSVVFMKEGKVIETGDKAELLSSEKLSALFDTPVKLVRAHGFYQVMPGARRPARR